MENLVRGLEQISLAVTGKVWSGKELHGLVKAGNMEAEEVWRRFGADVAAGLLPVLEEYQPDLLLLGVFSGTDGGYLFGYAGYECCSYGGTGFSASYIPTPVCAAGCV